MGPEFELPVDDSPIILSVINGNFNLTSQENGVFFDLNSDGEPELTAWTDEFSDEAFLVLDGNENGIIDDGTELFGNYTPQPPSPEPNGFLALAEWDDPANGGNGDGRIDAADGVFDFLQLWIDTSHDGFSDADELFPIDFFGLRSIDLDYRRSSRTDPFGNEFRFRSRIRWEHRTSWCWDVFFVQE